MRSLNARARRRRRQAARVPEDCPRLRVVALRSAEWAEHRARALALPRSDIAAACGQRWRQTICACGVREVKVGCDQPQLCGRCRKRHSTKWRKKIVAGMDRALRNERATWDMTPNHRRRGMRPGIYLITLTAPHSGDLETDRKRMGKSVRKLQKHASAAGWWRTYALTWEATAGVRGDGHMHAHLAVVSSWVPYTAKQASHYDADLWTPRRKGERRKIAARGLWEVWERCMPGARVLDVQAPRRGKDGSLAAGHYLAKYVTKGIDPVEFTGAKAGELLVAFRSRRKVTTSRSFWVVADTRCACCGEWVRSLGSPCSLQELLPGAVLRSRAERVGYFVERGPPQVALSLDSASVSTDRRVTGRPAARSSSTRRRTSS